MRNRKNQASFTYCKRCAARRKPKRVKPERRKNKTWDSEARKGLSQLFSSPSYLEAVRKLSAPWKDNPWRSAVRESFGALDFIDPFRYRTDAQEYTGIVNFRDSFRSRLLDSGTLPVEVIHGRVRARYLGDVSCANNARSPHLQCAINPTGDCCNCPDYQSKFK